MRARIRCAVSDAEARACRLRRAALAFFLVSKALKMWVGGAWVSAKSGKTRAILNPADQTVLATVQEAGAQDVQDAVAAARAAFDGGAWPALAGRDRGALLFKIADGIRARAAALAAEPTRATWASPSSRRSSTSPTPRTASSTTRGLATKIHGETLRRARQRAVDGGARAGRRRRPDHPLELPAADGRVEARAGARGRAARSVLKPAEQTPLSALAARATFSKSLELPAGVVNIVTGDGPIAGAALVADPRVDKIAFTGGVEAGQARHQERRRHGQADVDRARRQEPQHRLRRRRLRRRRSTARSSARSPTRARSARPARGCWWSARSTSGCSRR